MTRPTIAHARDWLLAVRIPLGITESAEEATAQCTLMARSIAQDYSKEDLCFNSREAVSRSLRFFREPDIRDGINAWRIANAEPVEPLPPEALAAPISASGQWYYARFLKAPDDAGAMRALDTLRSRERPAFDWVVRNDHAAAGYAVRRGWEPTPSADELGVDWDDEAGIRRMAARIRHMPCQTEWASKIREQAIGSLLMVVGLHARQHLDAVVEELRGQSDPVPVAFNDDVTLFGEIIS